MGDKHTTNDFFTSSKKHGMCAPDTGKRCVDKSQPPVQYIYDI